MEKENIVGPILEKSKGSKIIGWSQEQLEVFFATDSGKELLEKANDKKEISSKHFQITRDYKTIDRLFYPIHTKPSDYYWTPESGLSNAPMRTPLNNLTKLLFIKSEPSRSLNLEERKDFFEDNITPLWKFVYGKEVGVKIYGLLGIYLSKEEYINAVYLLENVLQADDLNPAKVEITREFVSPDDPRTRNIPIL